MAGNRGNEAVNSHFPISRRRGQQVLQIGQKFPTREESAALVGKGELQRKHAPRERSVADAHCVVKRRIGRDYRGLFAGGGPWPGGLGGIALARATDCWSGSIL